MHLQNPVHSMATAVKMLNEANPDKSIKKGGNGDADAERQSKVIADIARHIGARHTDCDQFGVCHPSDVVHALNEASRGMARPIHDMPFVSGGAQQSFLGIVDTKRRSRSVVPSSDFRDFLKVLLLLPF